MKKVFIVLGLVSLGCSSLKDAPISISTTDSSYKDSSKVEKELYFQDPYWINQFFYCDSNNQLKAKEIEYWKKLYDSASKVNPLKETIYQSHWGFVNRNVISKPELIYKDKIIYKVHPITYVAFGFGILCLLVLLYYKKK